MHSGCGRAAGPVQGRPGRARPGASVARKVAEQRRTNEDWDDHQKRTERAVAGAWKGGRANPGIAGELDRFMAAAEQRLGREGMSAAYAAFTKGAPMTVPGASKEDQARLDALARYLTLGREARTRISDRQRRLDHYERQAERDRDDRGWDRGR